MITPFAWAMILSVLVAFLIFGSFIKWLLSKQRELDRMDALAFAAANGAAYDEDDDDYYDDDDDYYEDEIVAAPVVQPFKVLAQRTATPVAPAAPRVLVWAEWTRVLATRPHVGIAAESQAGKSTLAMALLNERSQTDQVIIFNPHQRPGDYGGLPQYRSYGEINAAMGVLLDELEERKERASQGDENYQAITVLLEESPDVLSKIADEEGKKFMPKVPLALRFVGEFVRQAAKYKMRLILLTQSTSAKPLGLEGQTDVLANLLWVSLGERAAENKDAARMERPAILEARGAAHLIDVGPAGELSKQPIKADRVYSLTLPAIEEAGPASSKTPMPSAAELATIITALEAGQSGNDIIAALGGNRQQRQRQIAVVREALTITSEV